ncbi:hypothetical protein EIN_448670 [Entamoeba invadens IP1]|uniref:EGF-like domain-containing protein n=1 Tax=Entamoeba invadens IP1 TaxID=370355 RepID=L7FLP8_ENTIV|nr:hypothetical protein EIN_448670 [Entamoeba invadens IP1]ELP89096.1 hypothetical protein EIN_448670 [Entamoeba invadens IP1]|eukprot:XP_004255867.1 hypothetical protein EIN_448670 [Entamoeba invadens IP1]
MNPCVSGSYSSAGSSTCTLCVAGTYSSVESSSECTNCEAGTYSSQGAELCTICPPDTYSLTGSSGCVSCTNDTCISCDSKSGLCTKCAQGSGLISNGKCEKCQAGYFSIGGLVSCVKCGDKEYSSLGSTKCLSCNPLCNTCNTTNGECLSCYPGSRVINGNCVGCPAGQALNSNECIVCETNSYSIGNATQCTLCSMCKDCDKTNGHCIQCEVGYELVSNQCYMCSLGSYGNNSQCIKCPLGTYSDTIGAITCLSCRDNNYTPKIGLMECISCDSTCISCNKENGFCSSCIDGAILINNSCSVCYEGTKANKTTQKCDICSAGTYSKNQSRTCISCPSQYYSFENSSMCKQCESTCETCDKTNGQCLTCLSGYGLTSSSSCIICNPGTKSLDSKCVNCDAMTYQNLVGQINCISCDTLCASCDQTNGQCLTCYAGYRLNSNGTCEMCGDKEYSLGGTSSCLSCPIVCTNCFKESGICTTCQSGYKQIEDKTNKICISCSSNGNCSSCDQNENESLRNCVECTTGYYLDNNNCNILSLLFWGIVSNDSTCLRCEEGTVKSGDKTCSKCYELLDNCQSCNYNNGTPKCIKCFTSYYIENGKCVLAYSKTEHYNYNTCLKEVNSITGCLLQVNNSCFSCGDKYILNEQKCVQKDETMCQKYSQTICEKCVMDVITTNENCSINSECKYQLTTNSNITCLSHTKESENNKYKFANCHYLLNDYCYLANEYHYTSIENGRTNQCDNGNICRLIEGTEMDFFVQIKIF